MLQCVELLLHQPISRSDQNRADQQGSHPIGHVLAEQQDDRGDYRKHSRMDDGACRGDETGAFSDSRRLLTELDLRKLDFLPNERGRLIGKLREELPDGSLLRTFYHSNLSCRLPGGVRRTRAALLSGRIVAAITGLAIACRAALHVLARRALSRGTVLGRPARGGLIRVAGLLCCV